MATIWKGKRFGSRIFYIKPYKSCFWLPILLECVYNLKMTLEINQIFKCILHAYNSNSCRLWCNHKLKFRCSLTRVCLSYLYSISLLLLYQVIPSEKIKCSTVCKMYDLMTIFWDRHWKNLFVIPYHGYRLSFETTEYVFFEFWNNFICLIKVINVQLSWTTMPWT